MACAGLSENLVLFCVRILKSAQNGKSGGGIGGVGTKVKTENVESTFSVDTAKSYLRCGNDFKRRKEIYEALYPETKAGVAGAVGKHSANSANVVSPFADDSAKAKIETRTDISQNSVESVDTNH